MNAWLFEWVVRNMHGIPQQADGHGIVGESSHAEKNWRILILSAYEFAPLISSK